MIDIQFGAGHIYALATIQVALFDGSGVAVGGYITPNQKSLKLNDDTTGIDLIKNGGGIINSLLGAGDCMLSCSFDFIPEGLTRIAAALNARLPISPSPVTITGAPVIPAGKFGDALNTTGENAQRWFYQGGGSVNGSDTGHWTSSFILHRYFGILAATPVVG